MDIDRELDLFARELHLVARLATEAARFGAIENLTMPEYMELRRELLAGNELSERAMRLLFRATRRSQQTLTNSGAVPVADFEPEPEPPAPSRRPFRLLRGSKA